jgi:hypothetical protein
MIRKDITPRFRRSNRTTWPHLSTAKRECKLLPQEYDSKLYSQKTLSVVWNIHWIHFAQLRTWWLDKRDS